MQHLRSYDGGMNLRGFYFCSHILKDNRLWLSAALLTTDISLTSDQNSPSKGPQLQTGYSMVPSATYITCIASGVIDST